MALSLVTCKFLRFHSVRARELGLIGNLLDWIGLVLSGLCHWLVLHYVAFHLVIVQLLELLLLL